MAPYAISWVLESTPHYHSDSIRQQQVARREKGTLKALKVKGRRIFYVLRLILWCWGPNFQRFSLLIMLPVVCRMPLLLLLRYCRPPAASRSLVGAKSQTRNWTFSKYCRRFEKLHVRYKPIETKNSCNADQIAIVDSARLRCGAHQIQYGRRSLYPEIN